jgi:hypothetical protein
MSVKTVSVFFVKPSIAAYHGTAVSSYWRPKAPSALHFAARKCCPVNAAGCAPDVADVVSVSRSVAPGRSCRTLLAIARANRSLPAPATALGWERALGGRRPAASHERRIGAATGRFVPGRHRASLESNACAPIIGPCQICVALHDSPGSLADPRAHWRLTGSGTCQTETSR